MAFTVSPQALATRPAANKALDASAARAIAQAAVNVELFTIPLYMAGMYSLEGRHQITSPGNDFYQGRLWPGATKVAAPTTPNDIAFNIVFSVFIEEMLHLQIAANVASAIGQAPLFTSSMLQNPDHSWCCYGDTLTVIPHIVDLTQTINTSGVKVTIDALTAAQLELFLAIEQPEAQARANIQPQYLSNYFPTVPFAGWQQDWNETNLPMFGSIGWMYQCLWDYLNFNYDDGTTLCDYMFVQDSVQNDMFNVSDSGHPDAEYPEFQTSLAGVTDSKTALALIGTLLSAITDQGEGSLLPNPPPGLLAAVEPMYQANRPALEADYPGATDTGGSAPSPDAAARCDNDAADHFERFTAIQAMLPTLTTWPQWFETNRWTADMLQASDYDPNSNPYNLPTTAQIAQALNNMAYPSDPADRAANYKLFCQASVGSIAGVTSVLDTYWSAPGGTFPYPAMTGSGDRMAICWSVFGQKPDLSVGIGDPDESILNHCCQALDFAGTGTNSCAQVELFHACRGSNACKAQGGCGFVQLTTGGGLCGHFLSARADPKVGATTVYSVPSDNKCGTFGGCAVPISASQLLNKSGTMELYNFSQDGQNNPMPVGTMAFTAGQSVHDVAYAAFRQVMQMRGVTVPDTPPPPSDLRLVFIPST